jgi:hypothetical protein
MKVLTGHLTAANKHAIKAILKNGLMNGKVNRTNYFISKNQDVYTVRIVLKDRGLMPCPGSELRYSTYISTFIKVGDS